MRALRTVLLTCGLLLAAGSAFAQNQDAQKLLVGKWETTQKVGDKDIKVVVEFDKIGKATVTIRDVSLSGKYKFLSDGKLEVELTLKDGTSRKTTHEVKVTADSLELKDMNGRVDKFKRAK